MTTRIGLVHALHASIAPIEAAFADLWPEAESVSLFDQSLYVDYNRAGELTPALTQRVGRLLAYSADSGADGILFTGSLFGSAVEATRRELSIPVLSAFEALVETACARGTRLGVVTTVPDTLTLIRGDLERHAAANGRQVEIVGRQVEGAMAALQHGDNSRHDALVARAAVDMAHCDAILLGQFSMAPVIRHLPPSVATKTLTSPSAAVIRLRELLA